MSNHSNGGHGGSGGDAELAYPYLANCRVVLTGGVSPTLKTPVHLPTDILSSTKMKKFESTTLNDFELERSVLQRKDEFDMIQKASSREEIQRNVLLVRMKSVTGATNDDICISILESNGYDLQTSIEAYFHTR